MVFDYNHCLVYAVLRCMSQQQLVFQSCSVGAEKSISSSISLLSQSIVIGSGKYISRVLNI